MACKGWFVRVALLVALVPAEVLAGAYGQPTTYTARYGGWRPVGNRAARPLGIPRRDFQTAYRAPATPAEPLDSPSRTAEKSSPFLANWPQTAGQVWREYDLLPYTVQVNSTRRPEQAIVDWILRETGEGTWHGEQVAVLSASQARLRVFHEPSVQAQVAEIVDRFTQAQVKQLGIRVRVIGVGSPDWRRKAQALLRPIPGSNHGPQSWLLAPEDASLLLADLRARRDTRMHGMPHLLVFNGQTATVNSTQQQSYVRHVTPRPGTWPGYQSKLDYIDEGFVLELNPLLTTDGAYVDAVIKLHVNQVEKLRDVTLDVASPFDPTLATRMQVPQRASYDMNERFHWPTDKVLLVGLGMVPAAAPTAGSLLDFGQAPREDLLLLIDVTAGPGQMVDTASRPGYRYRR